METADPPVESDRHRHALFLHLVNYEKIGVFQHWEVQALGSSTS